MTVYLPLECPSCKDIKDEMWSFVQSKANQRWLWHAISHETGEVLAYVIDKHHNSALLKFNTL